MARAPVVTGGMSPGTAVCATLMSIVSEDQTRPLLQWWTTNHLLPAHPIIDRCCRYALARKSSPSSRKR